MKKLVLLPLLAITLAGVGCKNETPAPAAAKTPETLSEKQAYSVGTRMAKSHKQIIDDIVSVQGEFDIDMYVLGIKDTLINETKLTEEDMASISEEYRKEYLAKKQAVTDKAKDENKKIADEFFAKNKTVDGVVVTESGLQYKVISEGTGAKPSTTDKVKVLYTGKLIDGTVFDTTSGDNKPREFAVNRVVKGWTEGLQLMSAGSKYELYIPPELGYGSRDSAQIPANSALIFEVELVEVVKAEAPKKVAPAKK